MIARAPALAALVASALFALPAHAGTRHYFTWRHQPDFHDLQVCAERMRPLLEARAALLLSSTRARSPFSIARSPGGELASGSAPAERGSARSASSPLLAVRYGALLVLAGLYVLDRRRRRAQKP